MRIHDQLDELGLLLGRAQQELQVAREQVAFQAGVADDAQIRMVVSGTPLADREFREARDDLDRLKRHEERTRARCAELTQERDALLERLLEGIDSDKGTEEAGKGSRL